MKANGHDLWEGVHHNRRFDSVKAEAEDCVSALWSL